MLPHSAPLAFLLCLASHCSLSVDAQSSHEQIAASKPHVTIMPPLLPTANPLANTPDFANFAGDWHKM